MTWYQTLQLAWGFASTLKPQDYVAVIAYDIKPEILSDFTTDRQKTQEALQRLTIPALSEANLFDAVTDTADRMSGIEGRKAILLISTGIDTFSKITYDQARKKSAGSGRADLYRRPDAGASAIMMDGHMGAGARMDFLQADNADADLRQGNRRPGLFPAVPGRVRPDLPGDPPGVAQPVRDHATRPPTRRTTAPSARSRWSW